MIGRLNHIAIAVPDLIAASAVYVETLGAQVSAPLPQPEHGVSVAFVTLPNTKIELLEPLGENSPIAGFLARNPQDVVRHQWAIDQRFARANEVTRVDTQVLTVRNEVLALDAAFAAHDDRPLAAALFAE